MRVICTSTGSLDADPDFAHALYPKTAISIREMITIDFLLEINIVYSFFKCFEFEFVIIPR